MFSKVAKKKSPSNRRFEKSGFHYKSFLCKRLQEEGNVQELKEQLEALTAHVDYVQENITDCQTSIMEMEVRLDKNGRCFQYFNLPSPNLTV